MSNILKRVLGQPQNKSLFPQFQRPTENYSYKTRFALVGTAGAGKTTVADLILLTMHTMSSHEDTFTCRVLEGTSDIEEGTSLLRQGHFPAKTRPYQQSVIEAGFLMEWAGVWGNKRIHLPIVDVAGEDIVAMIRHRAPYAPSPEEFNQSLKLVEDVRNSDGFIVVIPASRALAFHHDIQLERETGDLPNDPDVNVKRILAAVVEYREQTRAKPIKAVGVIITKWDTIQPYAQKWGMDILDPTGMGLQNFMQICFPSTSSYLKASHIPNIKFFPSFVQTEFDGQTGKEKKWEDNSAIVKVKPPNEWLTYGRVPEYSAAYYREFITWMKTYAA